MSEEMERLKSNLKHTSSARARAESKEVEVRSSLMTAEGELRDARSEFRALQSELAEYQEGLKSIQGELQLAREELIISRGERRDLQAELRAVTNDLNNQEAQLEAARREVSESKMLLETARREYSEAANSSERLGEECHGLRADLLWKIDMVAQRDEVIRQLRDQAGALGDLPFNRKPFVHILIWISTLTFQAMEKQRNPLAQTSRQGLVLKLRPPLILHRLKLKT